MFDSALIGPQFVSPSTRRPTSISGSDSTIASSVIHTGMSSSTACTIAQRDRADDGDADRDPRQRELAAADLRAAQARNVATRSRQRSASAVSPPATSMPVAGHITQQQNDALSRASTGDDAVLDEEVRRDDPREDAADQHADVDAEADDHAGADAEQAVRHADAHVREDEAVGELDGAVLELPHDVAADRPVRLPALGDAVEVVAGMRLISWASSRMSMMNADRPTPIITAFAAPTRCA